MFLSHSSGVSSVHITTLCANDNVLIVRYHTGRLDCDELALGFICLHLVQILGVLTTDITT